MYLFLKLLLLCLVAQITTVSAGEYPHDGSEKPPHDHYHDEFNELLGQPIKKIIIMESNNIYAHSRYRKLLLPPSLNEPVLVELKKYVLSKQPSFSGMSDTTLIKSVAGWVASSIKHDGREHTRKITSLTQMLDSYFDGSAKVRCQDISQLYANIMLSFGYVARSVYINVKNADYGTIGSGHVLTEVWSDKLSKWVMVDPQFGITARTNTTMLNYYEFVHALKNTPEKLTIEPLKELFDNKPEITRQHTIESYRKFIEPYNGTLYVQMQRHNCPLVYKMILGIEESNKHYMTFQGLPLDNAMFTNRYEDLYFDLNRVMLFFSYPDEVNWSGFHTDSLNTFHGYSNAMSDFAAKPNYKIHFESTMPWLKHINFRVNSGIAQMVKPEKDILLKLKSGVNIIEATAVNEAGIEGEKTKMKIYYGTEKEYNTYVKSVSKGE